MQLLTILPYAVGVTGENFQPRVRPYPIEKYLGLTRPVVTAKYSLRPIYFFAVHCRDQQGPEFLASGPVRKLSWPGSVQKLKVPIGSLIFCSSRPILLKKQWKQAQSGPTQFLQRFSLTCNYDSFNTAYIFMGIFYSRF